MIYLLDTILPGQWATMTDAQLAEELNKPATLRPMTLEQFFGGVVAQGGDPAALGELWDIGGGRLVDRAEASLLAGDLAGVTAYIATIPPGGQVAIGETTLTAMQAVIGAASLSTWRAKVAGPNADPATAEAVAETMAVRGWTWDGTAWTYTEPEEGGI